jgi:hypothetical protein
MIVVGLAPNSGIESDHVHRRQALIAPRRGRRCCSCIDKRRAFDLVSRDQTEVCYRPDGVIVVDRKVLLTEIGDRVSSFIRNDDNEPNLRRRRSLCRRSLLSRGYRRAPTCRGKKEEDMRAHGGPPEEQYSPRTRASTVSFTCLTLERGPRRGVWGGLWCSG